MRQGQNNNNNNNNKRTRGRGRKPQNQANRTYDSNGPDVKIRGSASHVAEKYVTLARDAQVSGDRIASENYLQHAEHYFRIIAAAQAQNSAQNSPQASGQIAHNAPGAGEQPSAVNGQGRSQGNSANRDEAADAAAPKRTEQPDKRGETAPVKDDAPGADAVSAESNDDGEAAEPSRPPRRTRTRRPRPPVAVANSEETETSTPPVAASETSESEPSSEEPQQDADDDPVVAEAG